MSDTSVEPHKENLPTAANPDLEGLDTGLEDFDTTDMVMPRLTIDHGEAKFVDNLTGEKHEKMQVVMLGLIKQRILWDTEVNDGDKPLCKSFDFRSGIPDEARFPWDASGFDKADFDEKLPCDACALKEWDSHPQRGTPWCSEQHTFPVLMSTGENVYAAPAILTVQRSAIKASKSYLTGFARSKTPLYTVVTEISLNAQKRGSVNYAVPSFVRVGATDDEQWSEYAQHYRTIREFISTPPPTDDEPSSPAANTQQPKDNQSQAATGDEDDLPF